MIGLGFLKSDYIDNQTYHRGGVLMDEEPDDEWDGDLDE